MMWYLIVGELLALSYLFSPSTTRTLGVVGNAGVRPWTYYAAVAISVAAWPGFLFLVCVIALTKPPGERRK